MGIKKRLIVCLDGTWNNQDSSTNVLHHFGLALSDDRAANGSSIIQKKFYLAGVGTGVLDSITGGGFGFGLEENVRKAYDWLVENYNDGDDPDESDEIYIFGFSRGAYTARSLVGFISTCGLLRRGTPLSVDQLWKDYCILGRKRERRTSHWERLLGESTPQIRRINELVLDPWNIKANRSDSDDVLGLRVKNLKPAERLLVHWSRRVRITYLGIYDTVGAMGLDALAIPGLTSKLAMHHNMRPTTIIQHCRHALALDENRSNFRHTPFLDYVGHGADEEEPQQDASQEDPEKYWQGRREQWQGRIEQRWFVGAHSNIGGGYPDNELAQYPLRWVLEGAQDLGLHCEPMWKTLAPLQPPPPRDSYAEFAKPFWASIVRNKRFYRAIDPDPERRASLKKAKDGDPTGTGFSLQTINERIDGSVFDYARSAKSYNPPNLWDYLNRKKNDGTCEDAKILSSILPVAPQHRWVDESVSARVFIMLWAIFAGVGVEALGALFSAGNIVPKWAMGVVAFAFPLIDWGESRATFSLASGRRSAACRAFVDCIYWVRTLGVVLFAAGVSTAIVYLFVQGWGADSLFGARREIRILAHDWKFLIIGAAAGVLFAHSLDSTRMKYLRPTLEGILLGGLMAVGAIIVLVFTGALFSPFLTGLFGHPFATQASEVSDSDRSFAGHMLLLQLALIYFFDAFDWVGEPNMRANLGSISRLQFCRTAKAVNRCLEQWRRALACSWEQKEKKQTWRGAAAHAMREILREALWRDIMGFIPVYLIVLTLGLWFAQAHLQWSWLNLRIELPWLEGAHDVPAWVLLPVTAGIADWLEDICHLRYLAYHEKSGKVPTWLPPFAWLTTVVKFVAFAAASLVIVAALGVATYELHHVDVGWRGALAFFISVAAALILSITLVSAVVHWFRSRSAKPRILRITSGLSEASFGVEG